MQTAPPVTSSTIRAGQYVLVTALWHFARFDRWPTTLEITRMKSWSYPGRAEGLDYIRQAGYFVKERDENGTIIHRVTRDGRRFVTPPSMERTSFELPIPLPDDEDEQSLVMWMSAHYERSGKWPTPWHYQLSGLYRTDSDVFHETLERLVQMGRLVRIQIARGPRRVTRLVDVTYCPWLEGTDGRMYFWDTQFGEFPEP